MLLPFEFAKAGESFEGNGEATNTSQIKALSVARDEARAEIAKSIKSAVDAQSNKKIEATRSLNPSGGITEIVSRTFTSQHSVRATSDFVTEVQTLAEDYDKVTGRAHVKLRLNRRDWLVKYKPRLLDLGNRVGSLVSSARSSSIRLARIRALRSALDLLNKHAPLVEAYDAIRFPNDPDFPDSSLILQGSFNSISGELIRESMNVEFSLQLEGDADLRDRVSKALLTNGFKVTNNGPVIIRVRSEKETVADPKISNLKLHAQIRRLYVTVNEGSESFGFEIQVSEAAESEQLAELRSRDLLRREIESNFVARLFSAL